MILGKGFYIYNCCNFDAVAGFEMYDKHKIVSLNVTLIARNFTEIKEIYSFKLVELNL